MKHFKLLLALCAVLPSFALADLHLATPNDLLAKAAIDRTSLRDVVLDIEQNIPEMRDPATFESYFFILDQLAAQAQRLGLDQFYPNAVQTLGLHMVSNGIRWVDFRIDMTAKLPYYVKWMDVDTLARLEALAEYQVTTIKEDAGLIAVANNIAAILPGIDAAADKNLPFVVQGFKAIESNAAVSLLKLGHLSPADEQAVIAKITLASSMSTYIDFLSQSVYTTQAANKAALHAYLARAGHVNKAIMALSDLAPTWLFAANQDVATETLERMVTFEEPFLPGEFEAAIALLDARHLQALISYWMAPNKLPTSAFVDQYIEISRVLVQKADSAGLPVESLSLSKWLEKAAAPVLAKRLGLEGKYKLVDGSGQTWIFTVVSAKDDMLIAALGDIQGAVFKTFYNISVNVRDGGFIASEREPDMDASANPPIKFSIDKNGTLTLFDAFIRSGSNYLKGTKVQSFTDVNKTVAKDAPATADGIYNGTITLPSGSTMKAKLTVTSFSGYTMARLDGEGVTVDFNVGSKGTDGTLLLTSVRHIGATWMHIRANVTTEGLIAHVIVGGKGESSVPAKLVRAKN